MKMWKIKTKVHSNINFRIYCIHSSKTLISIFFKYFTDYDPAVVLLVVFCDFTRLDQAKIFATTFIVSLVRDRILKLWRSEKLN